MCGIAGIISVDRNDVSSGRLKKMTDIIAHRGPDGEGQWVSDNGQVGLGHRRLSIIDLSSLAGQPMTYLDRYKLTFNGEIYNYIELKETLLKQGYSFKTTSDTEVLLALYDKYSEDCLQFLDGMFAFVIYDNKTNEIFAARDRFGEKPFFYSYKQGAYFLFGSEMKCLWEAGLEKKINNRMLYDYLNFGSLDNYNEPSETFYEDCTRLPHGHYLKLNVTTFELFIKQYYDIAWKNTNHSITLTQAKEKFHELFYTAVSRRLRSDVPVGSSLSGGLDSSLVVTVIDELRKQGDQKQATFSAIFPGFKKDERKYIDHVIGKTNVSPHFVTPDDEGLIATIDKLCWHQEEPFGSASIYVQYCVMQLAKENKVTVLLDGQGADEVLAGYHVFYNPFFSELKKTNPALRKQELAAYVAMHGNSEINADIRAGFFQRLKTASGNYAPGIRKWHHQRTQKKSLMLESEFYRAYHVSSHEFIPHFEGLNDALYQLSFKQGLQELLRYADRNSMAHGREVRLPFLYHELAEFLLTLPPQMKIHEGWTKWIMRETFDKELPAEIRWRTDKIGYAPPHDNWLERKEVKQKIRAAKNKLVDSHILKPSAMEKDGRNDWRFWMAGEIMP